MDVWFPGSQELYGIPEHAASMALKATTGDGASYSDPYRLYTLDVFEYELDVPMALYGAIPLAVSHGAGGTAAAFWWNPSETFVDVRTGECDAAAGTSDPHSCAAPEGGKGVRWLSESGVVDLMILPGPTPADMFKQYMLLTGAPRCPPTSAWHSTSAAGNYRDEADVAAVDAGFEV
ncbi:galactose mutarotase-like-domain-containing protein, partial [Tribonema minus]